MKLSNYIYSGIIACFLLFSCKGSALKNEVTCLFLEGNKIKNVYSDSIIFLKDVQIDSFYLVPPYYPINDVGKKFNSKFICNSNYVPGDYFMLFKPDKEHSKALFINTLSNNFLGYSLKDSSDIFNGIFIKDVIYL